jgi:8-oxo-dGTP diphosphatase
MSKNHITPKIGISAIIRKDKQVLLGQRIYKDERTWSFPGGHLEIGESILDCAQRETLEETGLRIKNLRISPYITEDIFPDTKKHYIAIYVLADYVSGNPQILEPDKFGGWDWFDWNNLPKPYFLNLENFLRKNYDPFI